MDSYNPENPFMKAGPLPVWPSGMMPQGMFGNFLVKTIVLLVIAVNIHTGMAAVRTAQRHGQPMGGNQFPTPTSLGGTPMPSMVPPIINPSMHPTPINHQPPAPIIGMAPHSQANGTLIFGKILLLLLLSLLSRTSHPGMPFAFKARGRGFGRGRFQQRDGNFFPESEESTITTIETTNLSRGPSYGHGAGRGGPEMSQTPQLHHQPPQSGYQGSFIHSLTCIKSISNY